MNRARDAIEQLIMAAAGALAAGDVFGVLRGLACVVTRRLLPFAASRWRNLCTKALPQSAARPHSSADFTRLRASSGRR